MPKSNAYFCDLSGYRKALLQIAEENNLNILKNDGSLKYPGNDCGLSNQTWFNCINGLYAPQPQNLRKVLIALKANLSQSQKTMAYLGTGFSNLPYDQAFIACLKSHKYKNWFDVAEYIECKTGLFLEESA